MPRVYLYSLANTQQTAVTDSWYGSGEPVFSDDGKYLVLASARDFKPTFGDQEFANVYRDMQRVYLVTLAKDTPNPPEPKSDEVGKAAEKREKEKAKQAEEKKPEASPGEKKPEEKSKKPVVVKVDTDEFHNGSLVWKSPPVTIARFACLMTAESFICAVPPAMKWARTTKKDSRTKTRNRTSALTISTTARRPCWATSIIIRSLSTEKRCW